MASSIKKSAIDYSLIACSFHEASHTICALLNYFEVPDVSMRIDGNDAVGLTSFYTYKNGHVEDDELFRIMLLSDIQVAYAGLVGEKHYYKDICGNDKFPIHLRIGSAEDIEVAAKLIRKHNLASSGKSTYILKKRIQKDVNDVLIEFWASVKIIAHALYAKRKLDYDDLKYLLTRKSDQKDYWKEKFKAIKFIHNDNKVPPEKEVKDILLENSIFSI